MLPAIAAAKTENDRMDARKMCDCLRCDFLPECYMARQPFARRRTLRHFGGGADWPSLVGGTIPFSRR